MPTTVSWGPRLGCPVLGTGTLDSSLEFGLRPADSHSHTLGKELMMPLLPPGKDAESPEIKKINLEPPSLRAHLGCHGQADDAEAASDFPPQLPTAE